MPAAPHGVFSRRVAQPFASGRLRRPTADTSAIQSEQIMWIVKVALQRPYTFIMLALLIVFMGGYAILNTATDIFPNIKIPIAAVIWRYNGILPRSLRGSTFQAPGECRKPAFAG
jgi:hypothetical protein